MPTYRGVVHYRYMANSSKSKALEEKVTNSALKGIDKKKLDKVQRGRVGRVGEEIRERYKRPRVGNDMTNK